MVKFVATVSRDAHYEAQQRTVSVSAKPAIGKELFSIADSLVGANSYQGQFETERFLHGKIREYTLRSIAHSNSSNSSLNEDSSHGPMDLLSDVALYRMMAENVPVNYLKGLDILSVPKGIRYHVVAKLLHDNGAEKMVDISSDMPSSSQMLPSSVPSNRVLMGSRVPQVNGNALYAASIDESQTGSSNILNGSNQNAESFKYFLAFVSLAIAMETMNHSTKSGRKASFLDIGLVNSPTGKYDPTNSTLEVNSVSRTVNDFKKESGFGTAPIRYQQAMATGPPE